MRKKDLKTELRFLDGYLMNIFERVQEIDPTCHALHFDINQYSADRKRVSIFYHWAGGCQVSYSASQLINQINYAKSREILFRNFGYGEKNEGD